MKTGSSIWMTGIIPVLAIAMILVFSRGLRGATNPLEGKEAPAFSLETLAGGTFDLKEHLGKRPVVLDFWAVWCPPCRASLPKVAETVKGLGDADLAFSTVNLGDSPDKITEFLKSKNLEDLPVALDKNREAAKLYGIQSIPTMVLIDKEGKVAVVSVGAMTESALSAALKKLLD